VSGWDIGQALKPLIALLILVIPVWLALEHCK
jgi:hypothetical protein